MEDGFIGFCFYCNRPVKSNEGYYLNPNPMGNVFDTAKPVHRKCHRSQDEELPFDEPTLIGPGDPL